MTIDNKSLPTSEANTIDNFEPLLQEFISVWQHGFMGIDIGKILISLLIFTTFLLIRGLFSKYILTALYSLSSKSDTKLDDKIISALIPPIKFIPVILGIFFACRYAGIDESLSVFFPRFIRTLIVFTLFWAIHRILVPMSHAVRGLEKILTKVMVLWIFKALKVLVIFIGVAITLELWGIKVGPLLAGLGLFGAAVALGAQDLFKNLIGGLTVIAEKRFYHGDWVKVDGVVEGTVEDIGFRSTKIRRFDKAPVHVPNSQLSDAVVTNFSRMTHRRIYWMLNIEYGTSVEQLKIIRDEILNYLNDNSDIFDLDVSTFVRIDSFGESSIDLMIYCFTKTTNWGEWLEIKEEFAFTIKDIVENKAGAGFAFPSQSLYIEKFPDDGAEIFVPPTKNSKHKKVA